MDIRNPTDEQFDSYASLYEFLRARRDLPRDEKNPLPAFVILGRFHSDESGRCSRLHRGTFTDADRAGMPPVMDGAWFQAWFETHVKDRTDDPHPQVFEGDSAMFPLFPLPPPHLVCPPCGKGWELERCHDIDGECRLEEVALDAFVGMTLREVSELLGKCTDATRKFAGDLAVTNPRWASKDPDIEYPTQAERGTRDAHSPDYRVTLDHVVVPGDTITVFARRYYHGPCFQEMLAERNREQWNEFTDKVTRKFVKAGFTNVRVSAASFPDDIVAWLEANIDGDAAADPYFLVETDEGRVGVWAWAHPMLDLLPSGITIAEIDPKAAIDLNDDTPSIVPFTGKRKQLLRLWQLMMKKRLAASQPAAS